MLKVPDPLTPPPGCRCAEGFNEHVWIAQHRGGSVGNWITLIACTLVGVVFIAIGGTVGGCFVLVGLAHLNPEAWNVLDARDGNGNPVAFDPAVAALFGGTGLAALAFVGTYVAAMLNGWLGHTRVHLTPHAGRIITGLGLLRRTRHFNPASVRRIEVFKGHAVNGNDASGAISMCLGPHPGFVRDRLRFGTMLSLSRQQWLAGALDRKLSRS